MRMIKYRWECIWNFRLYHKLTLRLCGGVCVCVCVYVCVCVCVCVFESIYKHGSKILMNKNEKITEKKIPLNDPIVIFMADYSSP